MPRSQVGGKPPITPQPFLTHVACIELDEESQELNLQINAAAEELERLQAMQAEDSRGISKHQKSTERYLAKRELLTSRRDACNKDIRDLGVLPEEAFEKYTNVKLERVCFFLLLSTVVCIEITDGQRAAGQAPAQSTGWPEKVCPCKQKSFRAVQQLHQTTRPASQAT